MYTIKIGPLVHNKFYTSIYMHWIIYEPCLDELSKIKNVIKSAAELRLCLNCLYSILID